MRPARWYVRCDGTGKELDRVDTWAGNLDPIKAAAVAEVRAIAEQKILAILPEYMQRNLTARAVELAVKNAGKGSDQFSADERAEWTAGQAKWNAIKAVRAASNAIEAQIAAIGDADALQACFETLRDNPLWPAE